MLATVPNTFDVDIMRQVPDPVLGINSICVVSMHDSGVVENDIDAAPGVDVGDHCGDVGFFRNVADDSVYLFGMRNEFFDFGNGALECRPGYVGHKDTGAFTSEEDAGL